MSIYCRGGFTYREAKSHEDNADIPPKDSLWYNVIKILLEFGRYLDKGYKAS
jgi:hypothetical protein